MTLVTNRMVARIECRIVSVRGRVVQSVAAKEWPRIDFFMRSNSAQGVSTRRTCSAEVRSHYPGCCATLALTGRCAALSPSGMEGSLGPLLFCATVVIVTAQPCRSAARHPSRQVHFCLSAIASEARRSHNLANLEHLFDYLVIVKMSRDFEDID